jgi:hypothetical protein
VRSRALKTDCRVLFCRLLRSAAHGDALCKSHSRAAAKAKSELETQQAECSALKVHLASEKDDRLHAQAEVGRLSGELSERTVALAQLATNFESLTAQKTKADLQFAASRAANDELEDQLADLNNFSGRGRRQGNSLGADAVAEAVSRQQAAEAERDQLRGELQLRKRENAQMRDHIDADRDEQLRCGGNRATADNHQVAEVTVGTPPLDEAREECERLKRLNAHLVQRIQCCSEAKQAPELLRQPLEPLAADLISVLVSARRSLGATASHPPQAVRASWPGASRTTPTVGTVCQDSCNDASTGYPWMVAATAEIESAIAARRDSSQHNLRYM